MKRIKTALVCGAGAMGSQIAFILASRVKNLSVDVLDVNETQLTEAREHFERWTKKHEGINKRNIIEENTQFISEYKNTTSYDFLLEAASENIEIKKKIFSNFNTLANRNAIFASNTSSLSMTSLSMVLDQEKRKNTIGLHFFNPPLKMKLLEIITTPNTSQETIQFAKDLSKALEKEPVICKDSPGFITSRLGIVMLNEAIFTLQEGLSSAQEIDTAMKLGYNHPMGPLELADLIGLDVVFAVTQSLYENFQDSKYRPSMLLRKKVEAGHLGRKTGIGFYDYSK